MYSAIFKHTFYETTVTASCRIGAGLACGVEAKDSVVWARFESTNFGFVALVKTST